MTRSVAKCPLEFSASLAGPTQRRALGALRWGRADQEKAAGGRLSLMLVSGSRRSRKNVAAGDELSRTNDKGSGPGFEVMEFSAHQNMSSKTPSQDGKGVAASLGGEGVTEAQDVVSTQEPGQGRWGPLRPEATVLPSRGPSLRHVPLCPGASPPQSSAVHTGPHGSTAALCGDPRKQRLLPAQRQRKKGSGSAPHLCPGAAEEGLDRQCP